MMISIAMATYNGEKYLCEQIDSILAQDYQDFELIVCDDCSKDATWEILQKYAAKDNRIHIYQNKENAGLVKNFERAISLCKGDYVALSDQDDIWHPDHLDVLFTNIGDNIACSADAILLENGVLTEKLSTRNKVNYKQIDTQDKILKRILYGGNPTQGAAMLMNSNKLNEILPLPSVTFHDVWIALCACIHNRLLIVDKPVLQYRRHENTLTKHEKHSQWYFIRHLNLNKYKAGGSDRLLYINNLLLRFPEMDEGQRVILLQAKRYFENVHNRWFRIKNVTFWIKLYPYLFPGQSRKFLLLKLIRFLIL